MVVLLTVVLYAALVVGLRVLTPAELRRALRRPPKTAAAAPPAEIA